MTLAKITDTEWEIMQVVWAKHPITASEIIERLVAKDPSWHPKTARALLARLVKKRALDFTPRGNLYLYEPLLSAQEGIATASESFLDRVFAGSLKPMLAHFVQKGRLTQAELDELRQMLDAPAAPPTKKAPKKRP